MSEIRIRNRDRGTRSAEAPREPVKPLPRLWKIGAEIPRTKTDPGPAEIDGSTRNHPRPAIRLHPSHQASPGRRRAKSKKPKSEGNIGCGDDKSDKKKVLVEETPALDTYESRRRARLLMGGLSAPAFLLLGWIGYRTFLYDPSPIDIPMDERLDRSRAGPSPRPSKDGEARFMFKRAKELDRNGQTDQAIAMLNKVVKVYKDTPTAAEAKAALDRSEKNLPLFATGPIVVAEPEKPAPAAERAAPQGRRRREAYRRPGHQGSGRAGVAGQPRRGGRGSTVAQESTAGRKPGHDGCAAPSAGISGQSSGRSSRVGLASGDRERSRRRPDGARSGRHLHDGQQRWASRRKSQLTRSGSRPITSTSTKSRTGSSVSSWRESQYHGQPPGKWLTDEKARAEPETVPGRAREFSRRQRVCRLGRQATPDRGAMGDGCAIHRRPAISLGRRVPQTGRGPERPARSIRSCPFRRTFRPTASSTWRETCRSGPKTGTTRSTSSSSPRASPIIRSGRPPARVPKNYPSWSRAGQKPGRCPTARESPTKSAWPTSASGACSPSKAQRSPAAGPGNQPPGAPPANAPGRSSVPF